MGWWLTQRNEVDPKALVGTVKSSLRNIRLPEARVIWWRIVARECGEKVKYQGTDNSWQRMSIEWLSAIFHHEFDFEISNFLVLSKSRMEDYLEWKESELYKVVHRIGDAAVDEYAESQYASGVKMLVDKMREGTVKAADTLFKSIGKADGIPQRSQLPVVEWVKNYLVQPGGKVVEMPMQIQIKQEVKGEVKFPELMPKDENETHK